MNKLVNDIVDCIGTVPDTDCVALYNVDPNGALAVVYSRYSGMLHKIGQRYFSFSREDVDSFVWSTLDKALSTFRIDAGANFATYVTRLMRNTMHNEYRHLKVTSVQRDWYVDVDNYNVFYSQGVEEDWSAIDITTSLPTLPLTDKQYAYIKCIVRNGQILTDAEIAKEIGVTRAAVAGIKRSLAKKLDNFLN